MPTIRFKAKLYRHDPTDKASAWALVTLPKDASDKLPSRGMTMVQGAVNGLRFRVLLQPDGQGSHWFRIDETTCKIAGIDAGDTVTMEVEPTKLWPEPEVPADLKKALAADPQAQALWTDITPMARWDWINWLGIVKQYETRRVRPAKLCSMLKNGKRRPCCFNRSLQMPPRSAELL